MKLKIANEAQAWEALERAVQQGFPDNIEIEFDGWPTFQMDIKGRDWDSTVPTRVMTPLLEVQRDINRAYTGVRYGTANLRKLRDDERDELEVVVKVRKGSSLYDADLWKQLSTIAEAAVGRMSGSEIVVTVLGLGLLWAAPSMYKAWLSERQKEKELNQNVQLSQLENQRMQIFAAAMRQQPVLASAQEDSEATQNRILKVAKQGDVLGVKGVSVLAEEAAQLAQPERERAQDIVLEGVFAVLGNRTDKSEGFRITVRRLTDGLTVQADVPLELPHAQQQLIQKAEWEKKKIRLTVNASVLREAISQAVVVSASEAPADDVT
ncbi:hypothetical protein ACLIJR_04220 [Hydrogenophaga sp. XSHU_21]